MAKRNRKTTQVSIKRRPEGAIEAAFASVDKQFILRLTQVTPADQQREKSIFTRHFAHEFGKSGIRGSGTSLLKVRYLRELTDAVPTERY